MALLKNNYAESEIEAGEAQPAPSLIDVMNMEATLSSFITRKPLPRLFVQEALVRLI